MFPAFGDRADVGDALTGYPVSQNGSEMVRTLHNKASSAIRKVSSVSISSSAQAHEVVRTQQSCGDEVEQRDNSK